MKRVSLLTRRQKPAVSYRIPFKAQKNMGNSPWQTTTAVSGETERYGALLPTGIDVELCIFRKKMFVTYFEIQCDSFEKLQWFLKVKFIQIFFPNLKAVVSYVVFQSKTALQLQSCHTVC